MQEVTFDKTHLIKSRVHSDEWQTTQATEQTGIRNDDVTSTGDKNACGLDAKLSHQNSTRASGMWTN